MTAGPINRALLEANYQNPGDIYSDLKTEGAFDVVADQIDDNWNYTSSLVNSGTLVPYPASMSRQAIINGNFDVWQRETTFTNPAALTYTADRFFSNFVTDGGTLPTTIIHSRQSLTSGDIQGSFYFYRIAPNGAGSGFGANSSYFISQRIEHGVRLLCGASKNVTVSFYARTSITDKKIAVAISQRYGTGGSPSANEDLTTTNQIITLTSSWARYTLSFTTGTLVGKTFGTNNDDFLQLSFFALWGTTTATNFLGGGTAETFVGAGNIDITQVRLCAGDVDIPFMPKSFDMELSSCLRYYEKSNNYEITPTTASTSLGIEQKVVPSNTIANLQPYGKVTFKAQKRTAPTVTIRPFTIPANTGRVSTNAGVELGANSGFVTNKGTTGFSVVNNSGGSLTTTDQAVIFHWESDAEL